VNDEIIACDGYRVDQSECESYINSMAEGQETELLISRDDIIFQLVVEIFTYEKPQFSFNLSTDETTKNLFSYWLR
jgi:hypothetical protein